MSGRKSLFAQQIAGLRRLWRHRGLVAGLTARNLKVKYKRSVLGFVWTLLNPLITLSILVGIVTHTRRLWGGAQSPLVAT